MKKQVWIVRAIEVIIIFIAVIIIYMINGGKSAPVRYSAIFLDAFDTRTEIIGYAADKDEFEKKAEALNEKLILYNNLYDIYNDYEGLNNIKTINDNAGIAPVKVDEEIIDLLIFSKEMYELTDGKINIAMGSVLSIWHEYREAGLNDPDNAALPSKEELEEANKHTDINKLIIDRENSTVFLEDSHMSLDVGSIGKGYGVQRVLEYAKEIGMNHMLISVGGNICALDGHMDGSQWKIGVQNPDLESNEAYIEKVKLYDGKCIATSGDYQRFYTVDGVKYCHIIDPKTLFPAEYFPAVSIITDDSGYADALSTSVFNMSLEEGMYFVNSLDGVEAMWVLFDGSICYSDHFNEYLSEDNE